MKKTFPVLGDPQVFFSWIRTTVLPVSLCLAAGGSRVVSVLNWYQLPPGWVLGTDLPVKRALEHLPLFLCLELLFEPSSLL